MMKGAYNSSIIKVELWLCASAACLACAPNGLDLKGEAKKYGELEDCSRGSSGCVGIKEDWGGIGEELGGIMRAGEVVVGGVRR